MSSNKRRKVDAPDTPQSAVSAIAARRRLRGTTPSSGESSAVEDSTPKAGNAFSVLQALKGANSSIKREQAPETPSKAKRISNEKPRSEHQSGSSTPNRVANYTSFRLNKQNSRRKGDGTLELRIGEGERCVIQGTYGLKIISGTVTVAGATLSSGETVHTIHAPACHGVPVIRTLERCQLQIIPEKLTSSIQSLARLSPLYRGIWNDSDEKEDNEASKKQSFQLVFTPDDALSKSSIQELSSPAEWNKKLGSLVETTLQAERGNDAILVCGPKGAGKSTFSKLLTNRLLTCSSSGVSNTSGRQIFGIAVLDLDPGQPEYTPAGTLSLVHVTKPNFGAPFSHTSLNDTSYKVVRCHALASPSPAFSPDLFLDCANDLYDTFKRTLRNCPLIINTPGWILGTGLDLLSEAISRFAPAQVIYMSHDGPAETVEILEAATRRSFSTLPSQPVDVSIRTAAHLRAMQAMSYFHLSKSKAGITDLGLSWHARPLTSLRPWQIRYDGGEAAGVNGILSYDYQAPPDLIADAINGMVLAVVVIEDELALDKIRCASKGDEETQSTGVDASYMSYSQEGLPIFLNARDGVLDPRYSRTIGLVLIRGIDTTSKMLQVITPIPMADIEAARGQGHRIILVHGKFDTPTWAYMEDVYERSNPLATALPDDDDVTSGEEDVQVDDVDAEANADGMPWVEVLRGNQKRPVGSSAWRVRRDLGRSTGD